MVLDQAEQLAVWGLANRLADAARECCMPYFRSDALVSDNKSSDGFDPVTIADRACEEAMRQILSHERPDDGILGEEFGQSQGSSGWTWVLDPIDGTRAFIIGAPTWGVLVALDGGDGPVMGLIDQPFTRERFIGGFGRAELHRDGQVSTLRVRSCESLDAAVLLTTFPEVGDANERLAFESVRDQVKLTRYGLDCYGYALVALGQADLVIEACLKPYDIQGPQAVVEAAGGIVTDWRGGPAHNGGRVVAAGDARVHAAALEILSRFN